MKLPLAILKFEIHVAHACNLQCESCSHYSNFRTGGLLSVEAAESWYAQWHQRIQPQRITLLGGEPALNPRLCQLLRSTRRFWPQARLWLVSNGFHLHRQPDLPVTLRAVGNYRLQISKHHDGEGYNQEFAKVVDLLEGWRQTHGLSYLIKESFASWTRRYQGGEGRIEPFDDGDAKASWSLCPSKHCMQLHEGLMWKCPAVAYLPLLGKRHPLGERWQPFLAYKALAPTCSDAELLAFMQKGPEEVCRLCPAYERPFVKEDPRRVPRAQAVT